MATEIFEKRFTRGELTLLRIAVEFYLDHNDEDEEVRDLYLTELGYNHPKYIKI